MPEMTTTLYLIRHGETDGGNARRYLGSIDAPLSERGKQQVAEKASELAKYLARASTSKYLSYLRDVQGGTSLFAAPPEKGTELSVVYCSGLARAVQSAEIIANPHRLSPVIVPDLRERSFGLWEGMTFAEIKEGYPEAFASWASDPLAYSPPGGETTVEVRDRVMGAVDRILRAHPGQEIAVVAHGGVNRVILCNVLGIPLGNIFRIEQDHAALNIVEFWEKYPVLKLLNG
jgi:broad specificity phosphatase PhoE